MMKRSIQIALIALWGATAQTASCGVSVPQKSVGDYIFTAPRLTNHIHGVLVETDSTNYYGVIRSEDVDWLNEAWTERACISSGGIPNQRIKGFDPIVNRNDMSFSIDGMGWLDPDAPLLVGARLIPYSFTKTNTFAQTIYTNGLTNAISVITMPMTNGAFSVYTNSWIAHKHFPVTVISTNVDNWSYLDYCHALYGVPFPAYSNANALAWGYWDDTYTKFPSVKSIAHAREILRGTKRLAEYLIYWTNQTYSITETLHDGGTVYTSTNSQGGTMYEFHAEHSWASYTRTDSFTADVPTRFTSILVTTGEANRVSVEAAFAVCSSSYHRFYDHNPLDIVQTNAIVRLGIPALDTSGPIACCRVSMNARDIFKACTSAACVPNPPESVTYRTPEGTSEFWGFDVEGIVLFYSITPSVKLPNW